MPSLRIQLGNVGGSVHLLADAAHVADLRDLALGFPSAVSKGPELVEVELSDFLANLRELARWTGGDVSWQPQLQELVKSNVRDAQRVDRQLNSSAAEPLLDKSEIQALLGDDWTADLTEFQLRDLAKLLSLNHGANFSVPGAGKTRVALAVFQALRKTGKVRRALIICPKAAFESWQQENELAFNRQPLRLLIAGQQKPPPADLLLVNYERLPGNRTGLARWLSSESALLILDEAHRTKRGPSGVFGSICLDLGAMATRRLILTGTPAPNGAKDLENLMGFVWPGQGRQMVTRALDGGDLRQASITLKPLFARTTKAELGLPPVNTQVRRVELPPLHREIYQAMVGEMSARARRLEDDLDALGRITMYLLMAAVSPALVAAGTTRYEPLVYRVPPLVPPEGGSLRQLMEDLPSYEMSPKYQEALAIVAANAARGRKTLVWSTFVRSLTTLQRILSGFNPAMVHGGTPDDDRTESLRRFREDSDCMVLLSNPATLGEGISLHQVCHDTVYIDRDFAAGRYLQSVDRIHRLGLSADTTTNVTVIIANNTIDESVYERLATKLRFMSAVLDDVGLQELADLEEEPSVAGGMDLDDVNALLRHLHGFTAA